MAPSLQPFSRRNSYGGLVVLADDLRPRRLALVLDHRPQVTDGRLPQLIGGPATLVVGQGEGQARWLRVGLRHRHALAVEVDEAVGVAHHERPQGQVEEPAVLQRQVVGARDAHAARLGVEARREAAHRVDAAADPVAGLQDGDVVALPLEFIGSDEAGQPGADDDDPARRPGPLAQPGLGHGERRRRRRRGLVGGRASATHRGGVGKRGGLVRCVVGLGHGRRVARLGGPPGPVRGLPFEIAHELRQARVAQQLPDGHEYPDVEPVVVRHPVDRVAHEARWRAGQVGGQVVSGQPVEPRIDGRCHLVPRRPHRARRRRRRWAAARDEVIQLGVRRHAPRPGQPVALLLPRRWPTIQPMLFMGSKRRSASSSWTPRRPRSHSARVKRSWSTSGWATATRYLRRDVPLPVSDARGRVGCPRCHGTDRPTPCSRPASPAPPRSPGCRT